MGIAKKLGVLCVAGIAFCVFALVWGFFIEPNRLVVNQYEISPKGWLKAHDRLKIVAISDLHGGSAFMDKEKLRTVVREANAQNPDLIVLLGDFVSQQHTDAPVRQRPLKMSIEDIADSIKGLTAKYGVIAVIGNHDDWYDRAKVRAALERAGIIVLVDEVHKIQINGEPVHIAGLRDFMDIEETGDWRDFVQTTKATLEEIQSGSIIALDHSPDVVPLITGRNLVHERLRLIMAGHTHGGQVWFPLYGSPIVPSNYGQRFNYGNMVHNGVDVFVTTGVGTSIMPVRFLVPPEIAVIEVRSKA